jgi:hypothetical protein
MGCWLAASPLVLRDVSAGDWLAINAYVTGGAIVLCAVLSLWRPRSPIHLIQIPIGLWLLGIGFLSSTEPIPTLQNAILVALLLIMFGIIPNEANQPPHAWRNAPAKATQ